MDPALARIGDCVVLKIYGATLSSVTVPERVMLVPSSAALTVRVPLARSRMSSVAPAPVLMVVVQLLLFTVTERVIRLLLASVMVSVRVLPLATLVLVPLMVTLLASSAFRMLSPVISFATELALETAVSMFNVASVGKVTVRTCSANTVPLLLE